MASQYRLRDASDRTATQIQLSQQPQLQHTGGPLPDTRVTEVERLQFGQGTHVQGRNAITLKIQFAKLAQPIQTPLYRGADRQLVIGQIELREPPHVTQCCWQCSHAVAAQVQGLNIGERGQKPINFIQRNA